MDLPPLSGGIIESLHDDDMVCKESGKIHKLNANVKSFGKNGTRDSNVGAG